MSERYIVAESSGYLIRADDRPGGGQGWVTEYMVQDTAYCHRVVWTSLGAPGVYKGPRGRRKLLHGRERAEEICLRFNDHGTRLPIIRAGDRDEHGRFRKGNAR